MQGSSLGVVVGQKASITKTVNADDVIAFSGISEDRNPIHLDVDYASKTRFKKNLAHGMLSAAFISAALVKVPDPSVTVIYLSQNLRFRRPVFVGDTVTATAEVTELDEDRRRATIKTICTNQDDEQVVIGEAEVMLDVFPFPSD
jgi:3-hydroxybutyryl-CoA dehydratase